MTICITCNYERSPTFEWNQVENETIKLADKMINTLPILYIVSLLWFEKYYFLIIPLFALFHRSADRS